MPTPRIVLAVVLEPALVMLSVLAGLVAWALVAGKLL